MSGVVVVRWLLDGEELMHVDAEDGQLLPEPLPATPPPATQTAMSVSGLIKSQREARKA